MSSCSLAIIDFLATAHVGISQGAAQPPDPLAKFSITHVSGSQKVAVIFLCERSILHAHSFFSAYKAELSSIS